MTETQTHDNSCPRCGGTGFDLQMDPCPCTPRTFVTAVRPPMDEAVVAAIEAVAAAIEPTPWGPPDASTRATGPKVLASPPQMAYLRTLLAERDGHDRSHVSRVVSNTLAEINAKPVTARRASELISAIKALPVLTPSVRPNKYSGTCSACGTYVAEGAGRIENGGAGWRTYHLVDDCPSPVVLAELTADEVTEPGVYRQVGTLNGHEATTFYRVRKGTYGRFFAQRIVTAYDGKVRFVRCGGASFLKASEKISMADARAFGVASGYCIFCGASLFGVDGRSAVAGYGPDCAKNHHLRYPNAADMKAIAAGATWDDLTA